MKKLLKKWGILPAIVVGLLGLYLVVNPVRRFVDDAVERLGFGGASEDETFWCPMHPEVVRKKSGMCPV